MIRFKNLEKQKKSNIYSKMYASIGDRKDVSYDDKMKERKAKQTYMKMFASIKKKSPLDEQFKHDHTNDHLTPHQLEAGGRPLSDKIKKNSDRSIAERHINKLHKLLTSHYGLNRSSPGYHSLGKYTVESGDRNPGYRKWNKALYSGDHSSLSDNDRHHIKTIKEQLVEKRTPRKLVMYSGVSRSPERHENFNDHHDHVKVEFPAFTSASLSRSIANGFAKPDVHSVHRYDHSNHKMDYSSVGGGKKKHTKEVFNDPPKQLPKEKYDRLNPDHIHYEHVMTMHVPKGSAGTYIGQHSHADEEKEFLIHPGARFHIKKKPIVDHIGNKVYWEAHMVHDGTRPVGNHYK